MEKTVVELFAGVGGFRVGLNKVKLENGKVIENGTWDFVWANQWEPSTKIQPAFDCYIKRFGESENHVNEDIAKIDKSSIPDHTLLVGGFPCQDYSVARSLSKEKGIEGKKGVLWWQIYEVLEEKRPPFVLLENVNRLLRSPSKQRGRDFGVMLKSFELLGYSVEWRVINAAEYGAAQKRRRVFIFAFRNDTKHGKGIKDINEYIFRNGLFATSFPIEQEINKKRKITKTIDKFDDLLQVSNSFESMFYNTGIMYEGKILSIESIPKGIPPIPLIDILEKSITDKSLYFTEKQIDKLEYLKGSKKIKRTRPDGEVYHYSEGSMSFPEDLNGPGRTMLTSESTINRSSHVVKDLTTGKLRKISPIEAERLNSFPDKWTKTGMSNRQRYFMMGNALVTKIIYNLSFDLAEIIKSE